VAKFRERWGEPTAEQIADLTALTTKPCRPYRDRYAGIRRQIARNNGLHPIRDRAAIDTLMPTYGIPFAEHPPDFDRVFGRRAPRILEIGSGMGETTATIAKMRPDDDFIAIEVHSPGVGSLLRRIDELALANVRIIQHDAVESVAAMIPERSLAGIHVFFPDPWPKKRHHKRRLLQPGFVHALALRLAPHGYLHVATDWEAYAQAILDTLKNWAPFSNSNPREGILAAIDRFYDPNKKVSLYVYSDDFQNGSINPVVREIDRRNHANANGERLVRIHAVAFPAVYLMTGGDLFTGANYATLMRIVCQRNGGTFVALPVIRDGERR